MILSPIYFVGNILPGLKKYTGQWEEALKGQAFFAPIYMLLTYISILIINGVMKPGVLSPEGGASPRQSAAQALLTGTNQGLAEMFINFIVIIAFLVFSLIVAKEWSSKAPGIGKLTSWATGVAGGATLGLAGRAGRNIIGSRAANMADNDELRRKAAEGNVRARLQLAAANKLSRSSFDLRGTGIGGTLGAGKPPKDGYVGDQKARAKKYEQYKPTDSAKKQAAENVRAAKNNLDEAAKKAGERAGEQIGMDSINNAEEELKLAQEALLQPPDESSDELPREREARLKENVRATQEKLESAQTTRKTAVENFIKTTTQSQQKTYEEARGVEMEMTTRMENMAARAEDNVVRGKIPFTNQRFGFTMPAFIPTSVSVSGKDKAKAIRGAAKGKSSKDQAVEALKKLQDEGVIEKPTEEGGGQKEEKKEE